MKKTILSLSLVVSFLSAAAFGGYLPYSDLPVTANVGALTAHPSDNTVPWPWGAEMPFPWSFVQGVWFARQGEFESYFVFRIVKQKSGINQLEVKQVDPINCEVIASGVGYEQNRVVRAQMSMLSGGGAYRVFLRAFNAKSVPNGKIQAKPVNNQYVVLSVIPFDPSKTVNIPMQLITNRLGFECHVQQ